MVGWHHWFNGHDFEKVLGVGDGQGIQVCWSPWGRKELQMTEWLNSTELMQYCCLQHWSLFPLPITSTTECFLFVCLFVLAQPLHSFWSYFSLFSSSILGTYRPEEFIFPCHIFLPFYNSGGSQGKNTEVVCHSLLQWTTFCQDSPPWPIHLGLPYTTWLRVSLSYTRLWSKRSI